MKHRTILVFMLVDRLAHPYLLEQSYNALLHCNQENPDPKWKERIEKLIRTIVLSHLDDKRIVRDRMRVCDFAASYLVKSESDLLSENGRKLDFDMSGKPKDKNQQVGEIKKQLQSSAIFGK